MNRPFERATAQFRGLSIGQKTLAKSAVIFIVLFIVATILSQGKFIQPTNLLNLNVQNILLGVVALGQFLVIVTGGIDLSIGSIIGFTSVSIVLLQGLGVVPAILISLLIAGIFGLINGALITYVRLPAFIVTMATMQIIYSATQIISGGAAVYKGFGGAEINSAMLGFYKTEIAGIDVPLLLYTLIILIVYLYMRTSIGHYTYAVGGNETAAHIAGLPTRVVKMTTYFVSALLAGVGGLIYILRVGEGNPQAGTTFPLDSVAAVVVGGASLSGGIGTLAGTVVGVLTISVLGNVLNLLTISPMLQSAIKGVVILLAVYMNTQRKET